MEFVVCENRIFYEKDGQLLAEVTFPARGEQVVEIDHTFVDSSLRGQGVAGKLMEAVRAELLRTGRKAIVTCSYAVKWFEADSKRADVLR